MSKTGLWLCTLYAAVILCCVGYAVLGGSDSKSRFVFLQLPIVLQSALAGELGLLAILQNISWATAYAIFAGPMFVVLYALGLLLDSVRTSTRPEQR